MGGALRILQAGNFCLNVPLQEDSSTLPSRLKKEAAQAKLQSAKKLFDTAIAEHVHLVLLFDLTGGDTDSRAYWLLQRQFERLQAHQIKVVCVESAQTTFWPKLVNVPENVHFLSKDQSIGFRIGDEGLAIEIDWNDFEFQAGVTQENKCCLQLCEFDGNVTSICYFTGSGAGPKAVPINPIQPQAEESENRGAPALVTLDAAGNVQCRFAETATVTWKPVPITVDATESFEALSQRVRKEFSEYRSGTKLTLAVLNEQEASRELTRAEWQSLLTKLRDDATASESRVWPLRIELQKQNSSVQERSASAFFEEACSELFKLTTEDVCDELGLDVFDLDESIWGEVKSLVRCQLSHVVSGHRVGERLLTVLS